MSSRHPLEKSRTPKRFYFLTALIYLPILFALTIIRARWYGYAAAGLSFAVLLWMRHAPLWQGLRIPLCFMTAFLLAFGGLFASRPERDVSLMGQIGREALRFLLRLPVDESVRSGNFLGDADIWPVPEEYTLSAAVLPHCSADLLRPLESNERAVLQLHGGAFVSGMNNLYRTFAKRYSEYVGHGTVLTPDYRLWPAFPYPAQQEDALDAWLHLTETLGFLPENILVVGDSAGGNLALSLCLRLRDNGMPLPRAVICMSPWADLSNSGPSHIQNATADPTFGLPGDSYDGGPIGVPTTYADRLNPKDPMVSPSFGDYEGFPPMLLQAGSDELLLSDSEMVHQNALQHGVDTTFTVYTGMFHMFQASLDILPESKQAWEEIALFIRSVYDEVGV